MLGSCFRSYIHGFATHLEESTQIKRLRNLDLIHREMLSLQCMKFSRRVKCESAIADVFCKIEKQNYNQKIK